MSIFLQNIDFSRLKSMPNDFLSIFTYGNYMLQDISMITSFDFFSYQSSERHFENFKTAVTQKILS